MLKGLTKYGNLQSGLLALPCDAHGSVADHLHKIGLLPSRLHNFQNICQMTHCDGYSIRVAVAEEAN